MNLSQKKQLNNRIKMIKNKALYIEIYKILKMDDNFKANFNNNGLYFNLNLLDDITLNLISELLNNNIQPDVNEKLKYNSYYMETEEQILNKKLISLNLY